MEIERRIDELGFVLPEPPRAPEGFEFAFEWVRVCGSRVFVSGHSPQHADGTLAGPFGAVPSEVSVDDATDAARDTALAALASIKRAIGDLDRISAWLTVSGSVNADHGFTQTTTVMNGFSDLIVQVFGPEIGAHARSAIGVAALPMNNAVVVSAEIEIDG
ncbi:RidA family protein [Rhodococcus sp. BP-252]|uniref:Transcriptional regulator n=1 Tax=Rhodococcoides kyotonense TaxID=398843 RepID=A0A177YDX7_9NOCA|nr:MULTISPECIES: RidA family protein [Rhodococcus]MBY6411551.1 RidA family protein [Rhodococcus sp. BP-320]MBY6417933.1 RidA family protein [Rhodococcus sp. BP-321]MBY6422166.1 RidA family protein [Rhodococcus sp. BP-324]MBY6427731.1 RidA family protein [Rhodococcus sp. BP-323]MBY6433050.1 RidA family protein [Rhodococcus sp. BP-322]